jgi:hypothetical protein
MQDRERRVKPPDNKVTNCLYSVSFGVFQKVKNDAVWCSENLDCILSPQAYTSTKNCQLPLMDFMARTLASSALASHMIYKCELDDDDDG